MISVGKWYKATLKEISKMFYKHLFISRKDLSVRLDIFNVLKSHGNPKYICLFD